MKRLLPKSLSGQLIALLVAALIVSQVVSTLVHYLDRQAAIQTISRVSLLGRMATIIRLLDETPRHLHTRMLRAASTRRLRIWTADSSGIAVDRGRASDRHFISRLRFLLGDRVTDIRVATEIRAAPSDAGRRFRNWNGSSGWLSGLGMNLVQQHVSVKLMNGRWLNLTSRRMTPRFGWAWPAFLSIGLMAIAIFLIVYLVVRRLTRPLRQMSDAADLMGRGEEFVTVPEAGPAEVWRTTKAFNRMSERLSRFVHDRTRMLAAISHDLRTPITTLRLRTELLEDTETRTRMLETLDDMQQMAEATLAFVREEAEAQDTREVNLAALVSAICEDMREIGKDVQYVGPERLLCQCRSVAIKRALRNLIENAVDYGEKADVTLHATDLEAVVEIDDVGPGISKEDLDEVFQPFVRLEKSRARETGGVGLGLAIARSIARSHGGDIILSNRAGEGLRALLTLPLG